MFGDVTDLQQRHHPKKYPINYCREDQRLSTEGKIVSKYWRGGESINPPYTTLGVWLCMYVRQLTRVAIVFKLKNKINTWKLHC